MALTNAAASEVGTVDFNDFLIAVVIGLFAVALFGRYWWNDQPVSPAALAETTGCVRIEVHQALLANSVISNKVFAGIESRCSAEEAVNQRKAEEAKVIAKQRDATGLGH